MGWVGSPKSDELREDFKRLGSQMVLDVLDLAADGVGIKAK
jgi:hypothetical protein